MSGRSAPQNALAFEQRVLAFDVDAVLYMALPDDRRRVTRALMEAVRKGYELPPYISAIVQRAGVQPQMRDHAFNQRLEPFLGEIESEAFRRIIALSHENAILPIWVLLARTYEAEDPAAVARDVANAQAQGFEVLNLVGLYDGRDRRSLALAEWDTHPNAVAHRLIADRLYEHFCARQDWLARWRDDSASSARRVARQDPPPAP